MEIKVVAAILDILKVGLVNDQSFFQAKCFNKLLCSDQTGLAKVLSRFRR